MSKGGWGRTRNEWERRWIKETGRNGCVRTGSDKKGMEKKGEFGKGKVKVTKVRWGNGIKEVRWMKNGNWEKEERWRGISCRKDSYDKECDIDSRNQWKYEEKNVMICNTMLTSSNPQKKNSYSVPLSRFFSPKENARERLKETKGKGKTRILTKREELSFLTVLALPKASRTGLVCTIWSSRFCKEVRSGQRSR